MTAWLAVAFLVLAALLQAAAGNAWPAALDAFVAGLWVPIALDRIRERK